MTWADDAACRNHQPDLWFPDVGEAALKARAICRRCPVRVDCLEEAPERRERHGIWGGLNAKEREQLRRKRRRA